MSCSAETPSVNSQNIGCIVRKHSKLTYDEIMADAIARSSIQLNETIIADFLFENGYRGSRQKARLPEIINHAKNLREKRD